MAETGALPVSLLKLNLEEGYGLVIIAMLQFWIQTARIFQEGGGGEVGKECPILTVFGEAGISPTEIWDPMKDCVANSGWQFLYNGPQVIVGDTRPYWRKL